MAGSGGDNGRSGDAAARRRRADGGRDGDNGRGGAGGHRVPTLLGALEGVGEVPLAALVLFVGRADIAATVGGEVRLLLPLEAPRPHELHPPRLHQLDERHAAVARRVARREDAPRGGLAD